MLDPFPVSPSPLLQSLVTPFTTRLHLLTLPFHIHEVLLLALLYLSIFLLAPIVSPLFTSAYGKQNYESRLRWNMHCASMAQSLILTSSSFWVIYHDRERAGMDLEERMGGYTGAAGMVQAFALGYFVFDLGIMIWYRKVFGLGMLAHATACVITYTLGFRPIFNYYGCVFVLYELSTPFLNIHWFCDKLGMTGSKLQLYNGLCLIAVFFTCRLCWGAIASYWLYADVWASKQAWGSNVLYLNDNDKMELSGMMPFGKADMPYWVLVVYGVGHVVLQALNVWWFGKMIKAVLARFRVAKEKET